MTDNPSSRDRSRTEQLLTGLVVGSASALMLAAMGRAVVLLVVALAI